MASLFSFSFHINTKGFTSQNMSTSIAITAGIVLYYLLIPPIHVPDSTQFTTTTFQTTIFIPSYQNITSQPRQHSSIEQLVACSFATTIMPSQQAESCLQPANGGSMYFEDTKMRVWSESYTEQYGLALVVTGMLPLLVSPTSSSVFADRSGEGFRYMRSRVFTSYSHQTSSTLPQLSMFKQKLSKVITARSHILPAGEIHCSNISIFFAKDTPKPKHITKARSAHSLTLDKSQHTFVPVVWNTSWTPHHLLTQSVHVSNDRIGIDSYDGPIRDDWECYYASSIIKDACTKVDNEMLEMVGNHSSATNSSIFKYHPAISMHSYLTSQNSHNRHSILTFQMKIFTSVIDTTTLIQNGLLLRNATIPSLHETTIDGYRLGGLWEFSLPLVYQPSQIPTSTFTSEARQIRTLPAPKVMREVRACLIDGEIVKVKIIPSINSTGHAWGMQKQTRNNNGPIFTKLSMHDANYLLFEDVPSSYPMTVIAHPNEALLEIDGEFRHPVAKTVLGKNRNFYYGLINVTLPTWVNSLSFYSLYHGFMEGRDIIKNEVNCTYNTSDGIAKTQTFIKIDSAPGGRRFGFSQNTEQFLANSTIRGTLACAYLKYISLANSTLESIWGSDVYSNGASCERHVALKTFTTPPSGAMLSFHLKNGVEIEYGSETDYTSDARFISALKGLVQDNSLLSAIIDEQVSGATVMYTSSTEKCPSGYVRNETACVPCPVGQFAVGSNEPCQVCSAGTYNPYIGQPMCLNCPPNTYANSTGSVALQDCVACPSGHQSNGAIPCAPIQSFIYNATSFLTCPEPGQGVSIINASTQEAKCLYCRPGTYSEAEIHDECRPCPIGTISFGLGNEACTSCQAGSYADKNATQCTECPHGTTSQEVEATSVATCLPCPSSHVYINSSSCIIDSPRPMSHCPLGTVGNRSENVTLRISDPIDEDCIVCPAGTYMPVEDYSCDSLPCHCTICPPGTHSSEGASTCTPCQGGTYDQTTIADAISNFPRENNEYYEALRANIMGVDTLNSTALIPILLEHHMVVSSSIAYSVSPPPVIYTTRTTGWGSHFHTDMSVSIERCRYASNVLIQSPSFTCGTYRGVQVLHSGNNGQFPQGCILGPDGVGGCARLYYNYMPNRNYECSSLYKCVDTTAWPPSIHTYLYKGDYATSLRDGANCARCPTNKYSDKIGISLSSHCKSCPRGGVPTASQTSCIDCPSYNNGLPNATGHCHPCPEGEMPEPWWKDHCHCKEGKSKSAGGACEDCPVGHYRPQDYRLPDCYRCGPSEIANVTGSSECTECPEGYISDENRVSCILPQCSTLEYYDKDEAKCKACAPGTSSNGVGSFSCDFRHVLMDTVNDCSQLGPECTPPIDGLNCDASMKYAADEFFSTWFDNGQSNSWSNVKANFESGISNTFYRPDVSDPVTQCKMRRSPRGGWSLVYEPGPWLYGGSGDEFQCTSEYRQPFTDPLGPNWNMPDACYAQDGCVKAKTLCSCRCGPCHKGFIQPDSGPCQACPIGYTSAGNVCVPCGVNSSTPGCGLQCQGTLEVVNSALTECVCKPGYGRTKTSGTCSKCQPGSFSNGDMDHCEVCPPGQENSNWGATECQACKSSYTTVHLKSTDYRYGLNIPRPMRWNTIIEPWSITFSFKTPNSQYASYFHTEAHPWAWDTWTQTVHQRDLACTYCYMGETNGGIDCMCPAGSGTTEYSVYCSACPTGTFSDISTGGSCTNCPAGKTTQGKSSTSSSACFDCPVGKYESGRVCHTCPLGKYESSTGQTRCTGLCPAGWAGKNNEQTRRISQETSCSVCSEGEYTAIAGSAKCSKCAKGKFQSASGKARCDDCPAGKFAAAIGATSCQSCGPGTYSGAASSVCKKCEIGQYNSQNEMPSCSKCAAGKYQPLDGQTYCHACPLGSWNAKRAVRDKCEFCQGGFIRNPVTKECDGCPAGKYSNPGKLSCQNCPAGKSSREKAGLGGCSSCPAGYFSLGDGRPQCMPCPAGRFMDPKKRGSMTQRDCQRCPPQTYQPAPGQTKCLECNNFSPSNFERTMCMPSCMQHDGYTRVMRLSDDKESCICAAGWSRFAHQGQDYFNKHILEKKMIKLKKSDYYKSYADSPSSQAAFENRLIDKYRVDKCYPCPPGRFKSEEGNHECDCCANEWRGMSHAILGAGVRSHVWWTPKHKSTSIYQCDHGASSASWSRDFSLLGDALSSTFNSLIGKEDDEVIEEDGNTKYTKPNDWYHDPNNVNKQLYSAYWFVSKGLLAPNETCLYQTYGNTFVGDLAREYHHHADRLRQLFSCPAERLGACLMDFIMDTVEAQLTFTANLIGDAARIVATAVMQVVTIIGDIIKMAIAMFGCIFTNIVPIMERFLENLGAQAGTGDRATSSKGMFSAIIDIPSYLTNHKLKIPDGDMVAKFICDVGWISLATTGITVLLDLFKSILEELRNSCPELGLAQLKQYPAISMALGIEASANLGLISHDMAFSAGLWMDIRGNQGCMAGMSMDEIWLVWEYDENMITNPMGGGMEGVFSWDVFMRVGFWTDQKYIATLNGMDEYSAGLSLGGVSGDIAVGLLYPLADPSQSAGVSITPSVGVTDSALDIRFDFKPRKFFNFFCVRRSGSAKPMRSCVDKPGYDNLDERTRALTEKAAARNGAYQAEMKRRYDLYGDTSCVDRPDISMTVQHCIIWGTQGECDAAHANPTTRENLWLLQTCMKSCNYMCEPPPIPNLPPAKVNDNLSCQQLHDLKICDADTNTVDVQRGFQLGLSSDKIQLAPHFCCGCGKSEEDNCKDTENWTSRYTKKPCSYFVKHGFCRVEKRGVDISNFVGVLTGLHKTKYPLEYTKKPPSLSDSVYHGYSNLNDLHEWMQAEMRKADSEWVTEMQRRTDLYGSTHCADRPEYWPELHDDTSHVDYCGAYSTNGECSKALADPTDADNLQLLRTCQQSCGWYCTLPTYALPPVTQYGNEHYTTKLFQQYQDDLKLHNQRRAKWVTDVEEDAQYNCCECGKMDFSCDGQTSAFQGFDHSPIQRPQWFGLQGGAGLTDAHSGIANGIQCAHDGYCQATALRSNDLTFNQDGFVNTGTYQHTKRY